MCPSPLASYGLLYLILRQSSSLLTHISSHDLRTRTGAPSFLTNGAHLKQITITLYPIFFFISATLGGGLRPPHLCRPLDIRRRQHDDHFHGFLSINSTGSIQSQARQRSIPFPPVRHLRKYRLQLISFSQPANRRHLFYQQGHDGTFHFLSRPNDGISFYQGRTRHIHKLYSIPTRSHTGHMPSPSPAFAPPLSLFIVTCVITEVLILEAED